MSCTSDAEIRKMPCSVCLWERVPLGYCVAVSAYQREEYFPPGEVRCVQGLGRCQCVPRLCLYVCEGHTHGLGRVPMLFRSAFIKVDVCLM